jgi:hypothetical protein
VRGVDREVVDKTVTLLQKAGVLAENVDQQGMIWIERQSAS